MTELEGYLETIGPELDHVLRLFGMQEGNLLSILPRQAEEREGCFFLSFGEGERKVSRSAAAPRDEDPRLRELHRRRAARRLCKQTLYDYCSAVTGIHPPWGSLTGVRPTHLMLEALAEGLSPAQAEQRLIGEFDVSPEKATLLSQVAMVQSGMPAPGDAWMDVYVGIPFCTTRCAYCSFSSGELGDGRLVAPYLDALEREMNGGADILRQTGRKLRAVYVGGGTPTALPEPAFRRLLELLGRLFPSAMEYTVEAGRPDTLTRGKLRAIRESGVKRISINPQTMNDRTLRVIGRAHTAEDVWQAYALAREENIGHINMDVIAGLPGEDETDFAVTMAAAEKLRPESLTVHTLALKRTSRLSLEKAPLPDGEMTARMVRAGRETALTLGMRPYYLYKQKYMAGNQENTGYALPGHECIYNVDMMEETSHILAFGAGAISKRIYPEEGHIGRAPNVSNIEVYIARVEEMLSRKRELFLENAEA